MILALECYEVATSIEHGNGELGEFVPLPCGERGTDDLGCLSQGDLGRLSSLRNAAAEVRWGSAVEAPEYVKVPPRLGFRELAASGVADTYAVACFSRI